MAEIKCPMCGKPNPAELDVCQFCEARLKPLTDELSRSQPPIRPGDEPIDRNTSDLEPVLPQWLREVRQQARDSTEEAPEQAPAEDEAVQPEEKPADLLAGLQSQSEDKEEIPDWLAGLRGDSVQAVPEETSTEEDDLDALRSMFGEASSESENGIESALPGWISDLGAEAAEQQEEDELSDLLAGHAADEEPVQTEARPAVSESDFEWTADFDSDSDTEAESTQDSTPIDTELPNWLKDNDNGAKSETDGGLPDWMGTEEPAQQSAPPFENEESIEDLPLEAAQATTEGDLPDWLAALGEESSHTDSKEETAQPAADIETPDWLESLGEEGAEAPSQEAKQPAFESDTPDWLASLSEESSDVSSQEETSQSTADIKTPDWLTSLDKESADATPREAEQPAAEGDMPDWLSALGDESGEAVPPQDAEPSDAVGEAPDWLSSLGESTSELGGVSEGDESFVLPIEEPAREEEVSPAFTDIEAAPSSTEDSEDIFSMEMPDWLSGASAGIQVEEEVPTSTAEAQDDDLRPADLPSWVQAMRPVEAVIAETEGGASADQPVEEKGPLAGLRGVLPAMPGVGPSSKPESYSIKLRASEEQQSGAAMLEQMLAAETHPKPITTQKVVLSQRFLRWVIAIVLLFVVGGSIFTGTQVNPLPTSAPMETSAALQYIRESLPADAPVLLIFDYDAAQAGELEAAAAPLVDYMLLLKHPRLGIIASNPVGAGLAESFMANTQSGHNYQSGQQVVNLGYLPGGAAGVLAFAENPATIKPTTINRERAWETPALQGVSQLSDFAAMILLTNDVETARIWIEQTESIRGETRFLVISSAQSGPMILPYVQSGQVDGMVTGLDGSAPIERVNNGRPGTVRRYWDAYGFGLLAALTMISVGSLWSLVSGLRDRRREQGEA